MKGTLCLWSCLASLLICGTSFADANVVVVGFAKEKLGEQVGNGECATLVGYALREARCKHNGELGPVGQDADYVWGKLVAKVTPEANSIKNVKPGDIIQFRAFEARWDEKRVLPNGRYFTRYWIDKYPHHTAIVRKVEGNFVQVYHQNVGSDKEKRKTVQEGRIWVGPSEEKFVRDGGKVTKKYQMLKGTLWFYRPIPRFAR